MGLERFGAVLMGKHDVFSTDTLRALVEASAQATGTDPDGGEKFHHRVIADHLRSSAFLIADGVMPSNEGRGYVLRRIMRRAMRHAHQAGAADPVMHRLVGALVQEMGAQYAELGRARALIEETLKTEETRFKQTLERGLRLLDDELAKLPEGGALPGAAAFRLYDTYGFPLDLTQDALREKGRAVDTAGFDAAMAEQKAKARASWSGTGEAKEAAIWFELAESRGATEFLGYDTEKAEGQVLALVRDGAEVAAADKGDSVALMLNQTPFYAEAGGQVGDAGTLVTEGGRARITDVKKTAGVFVHLAEVTEGRIEKGAAAVLEVDHARRGAIRANHSATHLLNEALRETLGEHVAQRGSLNAPDRLRFDFAHSKAVTAQELAAVEAAVNAFIRQNGPVETRIMTPDDARAIGAQALFGEKYGDEVRVVSMGRKATGKGGDGQTWSIELCGGTHVAQLGEIGAFVVLGDQASSSGVRRIEALTGQAALDHLAQEAARLAEVAAALKAPSAEVADRVRALLDERRALQNEVAQLRRDLAIGGGREGAPQARDVNGITYLAQVLQGVSGKDLPPLIDAMKQKLGSAVVLLIAEADGKAAVAAGVTADLVGRISAVDVTRAAVEALGGRGGGGRPDMAQGGARDIANAAAAIAAAEALVGGTA
jgi:alanyl-tRNA synthetase